MHLSLLALLFVVVLARGNCLNSPNKVKESIPVPPHGWTRHGPAPTDHLLQLKIALPQPRFSILEKHLWEVSDPDHERYGAYLSKGKVDALMAPHPQSLDAVNEWLSSHGIGEEHLYRSSALDWVGIHVPVSFAEEMLDTKYHVYSHLESGESIVRTDSYSLPESLYEHVEFVQPTTMFTRPQPAKSGLRVLDTGSLGSSSSTGAVTGPAGNKVNASCDDVITITCLRQLYNAVGYNTSATSGNKIAVTAYSRQYASNEDLQQFFKLQNPQAKGSNYTFVSVNGGTNNQSSPGSEADLDTQYAFGLTYPTPATFYSTGGSPPFIPDTTTPTNTNEPYLDWLDYISNQPEPPQTISTSYADDEQTVPRSYATRVCSGFAALGVRGVSVIFASGDTGVGDRSSNPADQSCYSNDGTNRTMFIPQFPASCPFVTSVGGSHLISEVASNFSAGGFSNYFSRPKYQDTAVDHFLQKLAPGTYQGLFNRNGRGFPDVAAQSIHFLIYFQGRLTTISGTSCAAPTFASFVSMLNDARIRQGKSPMGFLNPWLYQKGYTGLNDITSGNNPGCGTQGFNATDGWDPVTGLGTPNFKELLAKAV